jgi:hypothetical protein
VAVLALVILGDLTQIGLVLFNVCRENRLVIPECNQNMMSLRGQASWAKMMSLGGKLTALMCHLTK